MNEVNDIVLESAKTNPTIATPQRGKIMLNYFTIKHPVNPVCGHKADLSRTPRFTNCGHCWFYLFSNVPEVTEAASDTARKEGLLALEQSMGKKFVKYFKQFAPSVHLEALKHNATT